LHANNAAILSELKLSEKETEDLTAFMRTLSCTQSPEVQTYGFIPADQVRKTTSVRYNLRKNICSMSEGNTKIHRDVQDSLPKNKE